MKFLLLYYYSIIFIILIILFYHLLFKKKLQTLSLYLSDYGRYSDIRNILKNIAFEHIFRHKVDSRAWWKFRKNEIERHKWLFDICHVDKYRQGYIVHVPSL